VTYVTPIACPASLTPRRSSIDIDLIHGVNPCLAEKIDGLQMPGESCRDTSLWPGSHGKFMLKVLGGFALSWEGRALRVPIASQRLLALLALQTGW
jgi:hypothetical protein